MNNHNPYRYYSYFGAKGRPSSQPRTSPPRIGPHPHHNPPLPPTPRPVPGPGSLPGLGPNTEATREVQGSGDGRVDTGVIPGVNGRLGRCYRNSKENTDLSSSLPDHSPRFDCRVRDGRSTGRPSSTSRGTTVPTPCECVRTSWSSTPVSRTAGPCPPIGPATSGRRPRPGPIRARHPSRRSRHPVPAAHGRPVCTVGRRPVSTVRRAGPATSRPFLRHRRGTRVASRPSGTRSPSPESRGGVGKGVVAVRRDEDGVRRFQVVGVRNVLTPGGRPCRNTKCSKELGSTS